MRGLYRSIQSDCFQLQLAEEIFPKQKSAQLFTTLDVASAFWQIPLADDSSAFKFNGIHHGVWPVSVN